MGFALVELVLVLGVLLVALSIFSATIAATSRQRSTNRENAIAAEAARAVLEDMRARSFDRLWALYNADPEDDPEGAGTAPGHRFAVPGLDPAPASPDGLIGEVRLPVAWGAPTVEDGVTRPAKLELREDAVDRRLGMPRDLNGDLVVDGLDHGDDYVRLPVEIELEWRGKTGRHRFTVATMLCAYEFGG